MRTWNRRSNLLLHALIDQASMLATMQKTFSMNIRDDGANRGGQGGRCRGLGKTLGITFIILHSAFCISAAQSPREFPLSLQDQLIASHEAFLPAPAGWSIPLIGVRNIPRQHLSSLVFFSDAFRPFSEISLPQTVIHDATPMPGDGAPLLVLAARQDSFMLFTVDSHRVMGTPGVLQSGENGLSPLLGSAVFAGIIPSTGPGQDTVAVIIFSFFDQPMRHVLAAYTLHGRAVWQMPIGAAQLRARVANEFGGSILFTTRAASHETGDTLRLSARKAYVGMVESNGMMQWVRPYGGEGTSVWCVSSPEKSLIACAIHHADSAEIVMLEARDGRERHFVRIAGSVAPQTLCLDYGGAAIVLAPNEIMRFDSALRPLERVRLAHPVNEFAQLLPWASDATRFVLFTPQRTDLLDGSFALLGFIDSGMVREPTGLTRYTGTLIRSDVMIAATAGDDVMLRTITSNTFWWWYRYRIGAAAVICAIMLLLMVTVFWRRFAFYRLYYNQLVRGSVTSGVVAINRQFRVIHLNNAARELLHIAKYIPLHRHITDYLPGAAYADMLNDLRDALQQRVTREKIVTLQTGGQPRTLLCRARPTLTRNGMVAGCLLQLEDVTHTIERERLMSWASVAHHVAHEMKTPIGTVLLNAQHVLKSETELPERSRKYFHRIVTQAERLSGILQNFLSIARVSTMRFSQVDVVRYMQSLVADYAELLPAHITISCTVGELNGTMLPIDDQQLTTAIRNILDNAVHAITPAEGSIEITLSEYPIPPAGAVAIGIRDTGRGMTEECRARMFEPFYTETPGGSGIGMVIVKRIIDEHKGFLEVSSEVGVGTEVRIVLPRVEL